MTPPQLPATFSAHRVLCTERCKRALIMVAERVYSSDLMCDVPVELLELVNRFEANKEAYKSGQYKEAQLRNEFLDPFFESLGWDVRNKRGYAEACKDVIHENAIKIGSTTKAPDYCFRVGGVRKLFVEAKKPSVSIRDDAWPAYQLRRYAWSAKLSLSILTNFEEFAVFDCRIRPKKGDKASAARTFYCLSRDYAAKWSEIAGIFAYESITKGYFDKYAESTKAKRGTQGVDAAFLSEINGWRERLTKNLAFRNAALSATDLNFAVQRTIDRIIFLRICEDRGIEPYGRLRGLTEGSHVYQRLCDAFRRAFEKYNLGLFHFAEEASRDEALDRLTPTLRIDDNVLTKILSGLYYPDSPYEFSVISADILGHVYEQFLGKVIRLTAERRAKIEEKPTVRKAGGVYYTPRCVVDHIVRHTVGALAQGKAPELVSALKVLDPACGSGSFLLGAYEYLLDWHRAWYVRQGAENYAKGNEPALFLDRHGEWRLTTAKRKEILQNNIFGVDIDAQAVEVTKLSLLLKVLEGKIDQAMNKNLRLIEERALPDLGKNIQCGNSLIDADYFTAKILPPDGDTINPFDWKKRFPEVFAHGGFDAVIGNPPYISYGGRQAVKVPKAYKAYLRKHYENAGWPTAHSFFLERAAKTLSRRFVSFIVPDQVGHLEGYRSLRGILRRNAGLSEVKYWGEHVFEDVDTPALTLVLDKLTQSETVHVISADGKEQLGIIQGDAPWILSESKKLLEKLRARSMSIRPFLADCGVRTTDAKNQVAALDGATARYIPTLEGKQVGRYWCAPPQVGVRLDAPDVFKSNEEKYSSAKFLIRQTAAYPIIGPHEHTAYFRNSLHALYEPEGDLDVRYVVALLNSKVMRFAYARMVRESGQRMYPQVKLTPLGELPVRAIDFTVATDKAAHERIVRLVKRLLGVHRALRSEVNPARVEALRHQADALDSSIDAEVYKLYDLNEAEINEVDSVVASLPAPP